MTLSLTFAVAGGKQERTEGNIQPLAFLILHGHKSDSKEKAVILLFQSDSAVLKGKHMHNKICC